MPYPKGTKSKYRHKVVENKNKFDSRSFRVKTLESGVKITIGCPRGHWSPSKNKCKVGTRIQKIMRKK